MSRIERFEITCDATDDNGQRCTLTFAGYGEDMQYWREVAELAGWRSSVTDEQDFCLNHNLPTGGAR